MRFGFLWLTPGRIGARGLGYSERKLLIAFFALMVALIIDNSLSQVADIVRAQIVSFWGVVLFVIISTIYAFGQFVILETIKAKIEKAARVQCGLSNSLLL